MSHSCERVQLRVIKNLLKMGVAPISIASLHAFNHGMRLTIEIGDFLMRFLPCVIVFMQTSATLCLGGAVLEYDYSIVVLLNTTSNNVCTYMIKQHVISTAHSIYIKHSYIVSQLFSHINTIV